MERQQGCILTCDVWHYRLSGMAFDCKLDTRGSDKLTLSHAIAGTHSAQLTAVLGPQSDSPFNANCTSGLYWGEACMTCQDGEEAADTSEAAGALAVGC